MFRRFVLASVSVFALTAAANAADMYVPGPTGPGGYKDAYVPVWSWTGFYAGVEGGGNWGGSSIYDLQLHRPETNSFDLSGGLFGGTVGYNYQVAPHWVIGIEDDISWTDKSGSGLDIHVATTNNTVTERWLDTLRGRVGYAWDRVLIYGTAGGAFGSTDLKVCGAAGCFTQSGVSRTGWAAGGGVEWAFAHSWSAKAEYLHVDFGSADYSSSPAPFDHRSVTLTDDIARVGLNYHILPGYEPLK